MKKRTILAIGCTLLTCSFIAYGAYWWQSPNKTSSSHSTTTTSVLGDASVDEVFQTDYFTTRKPDYLIQKEASTNEQSPIRASYLLRHRQAGDVDQVGITIGRLDGPLSEVSAVKLRSNETSTYRPVALDYLPEGAVAFRANNGFELAVFWPAGDSYAAVVVSGSIQRQSQLESTAETLIGNWRWQ